MREQQQYTTRRFPANAYYNSPQITIGAPIFMIMMVAGYIFNFKAQFFAIWTVVWITWSLFERRYWEPEGTEKVPSHDKAEKWLADEMEWPQYYVSGEDVDAEDFVPAYYRVEGPNGPVSYLNPNSGPFPATMHHFAMEAKCDSFRWCEREETPWTEVADGN